MGGEYSRIHELGASFVTYRGRLSSRIVKRVAMGYGLAATVCVNVVVASHVTEWGDVRCVSVASCELGRALGACVRLRCVIVVS